MNTCWNFFWNEGDTIDYVKPQSHYSDNQSQPTTISNYQQPISNQNFSPQSVADCLPTGRRVVDNQLPITRRLIIEHTSHFGTWSATIWRVIADWSPTVWRDVICIIFWITLPSKEIPTFLRPYVDSFMNTCWNFFWNEGDTIDYVNQLQQPVADQLRTTLPLFLHHLHFAGSNVYSFCMAALFGCRWLLMLHRKPLADQNCSAIINNHLPTIENHPEKGWLSEVGERLSM